MIDSDDRFRTLTHASSLCDLGRFEEALDRLGVLLAQVPDDIHAMLLLARALLGKGDPGAALEQAERAAALDPDSEWPRRLASIACRALGRREDAVRHAESAVELAPEQPETHMTLAQALVMNTGGPAWLRREDDDRARAAAERAVSLAPQAAGPYLVLGRVLDVAGDQVCAEAQYRRVLEIDPENSAALNNLARLRLTRTGGGPAVGVASPGALAGAAQGFADALAVNPANELARRNLDHVARVFLRNLAWLIFFDATFVARATRDSASPGVRLFPLVPLVLLAVTAVRHIRRLSPALRTHLRGVLARERNLKASAGCLGVSALTVIAGCTAPVGAHNGLSAIGALLAVVGYLLLLIHLDRRSPNRGRRAHQLGTGAMVIIAGGFALLGAGGLDVMQRGPHAAGGAITAVLGFGTAAAVLTRLARRRSARS